MSSESFSPATKIKKELIVLIISIIIALGIIYWLWINLGISLTKIYRHNLESEPDLLTNYHQPAIPRINQPHLNLLTTLYINQFVNLPTGTIDQKEIINSQINVTAQAIIQNCRLSNTQINVQGTHLKIENSILENCQINTYTNSYLTIEKSYIYNQDQTNMIDSGIVDIIGTLLIDNKAQPLFSMINKSEMLSQENIFRNNQGPIFTSESEYSILRCQKNLFENNLGEIIKLKDIKTLGSEIKSNTFNSISQTNYIILEEIELPALTLQNNLFIHGGITLRQTNQIIFKNNKFENIDHFAIKVKDCQLIGLQKNIFKNIEPAVIENDALQIDWIKNNFYQSPKTL